MGAPCASPCALPRGGGDGGGAGACLSGGAPGTRQSPPARSRPSVPPARISGSRACCPRTLRAAAPKLAGSSCSARSSIPTLTSRGTRQCYSPETRGAGSASLCYVFG